MKFYESLWTQGGCEEGEEEGDKGGTSQNKRETQGNNNFDFENWALKTRVDLMDARLCFTDSLFSGSLSSACSSPLQLPLRNIFYLRS